MRSSSAGLDLAFLVPRGPKLLATLRLATIEPERVIVALFDDEEAMRESMAIVAASPSKGFDPVRAASVWIGATEVEDEIFD